MTEKFFYGLEKIESTFNGAFCFYLSLLFIIIAFVYILIVSIKRTNYAIHKRVWFIYFSLGIVVMQFSENLKIVKEPFFTGFLCGVSIFLTAIIMAIPKRENKITNEQKAFIKHIDSEKAKEEKLICREVNDKKDENEKNEIQFSHVKNIIDRLDNFGLNSADKKTIHDLKLNISEVEKGDTKRETKEKINDGLSALLKIMAKYGA